MMVDGLIQPFVPSAAQGAVYRGMPQAQHRRVPRRMVRYGLWPTVRVLLGRMSLTATAYPLRVHHERFSKILFIQIFVVSLLVSATSALAEDANWNTTWDGTLYGYANRTILRADSILNPANQIARMAKSTDAIEMRMNLKAENDTLRFTARPIVSVRNLRGVGNTHRNDIYLSQWQLRVYANDQVNVAMGREVMNWGAAQFRSPSSPFYFDNGRSDPMRELVGMDAVKVTWTPDMQHSATLARIIGSGFGAVQPDAWRRSWLAKFDQQGEAWSYGVVAVNAPHQPSFYGAHGQMTVDDELMVYGEMSSSTKFNALQSPTDMALPFTILTPSPRRNTVLMGTTYTLPDGQSLSSEWLRDNHGYTLQEQAAYFTRAASAPQLAGQALGMMPRLLGRDYLNLVWQSNLMESNGYWRAMYTRSLTDGGSELSAYGEAVVYQRVTAFGMGMITSGKASQEMSALVTRSITAGVKVALH